MGFMDIFKKKDKPVKNSANIAKERLQIIVAHQRSELNKSQGKPEYLEKLQQEILEVIKKYVHISAEDVKVELENRGDSSVLELNISIPDAKK